MSLFLSKNVIFGLLLQRCGAVRCTFRDPSLCFMVLKAAANQNELAASCAARLGEVERCKVG